MKKAFTLIELVFVLVVIGVLAAVIIPSTKTNPLQEAAIQLASHIRYTQHLAMSDDTYDKNDDEWYKARWKLVFSSSDFTGGDDVWAYTIFSDKPTYGGDATIKEIAKNPLNPYNEDSESGQVMSGGYGNGKLDYTDSEFRGMKKLNIGTTYGINSVALSGGGSYSRISFDYLGRPITGDNSSMTGPYKAGTQRLVDEDCNIVIGDAQGSIKLVVRAETGYVDIEF